MTIPALPTISPECLTVINDQVTTSSLNVAKIFGKRHDNVLRAIDLLAKEIPEDFYLLNFEANKIKVLNHPSGEETESYTMTRDCSQEFKLLNFEQLKFTYRGQEFTYYTMPETGEQKTPGVRP